jgi:hypothetical protein
VNLHSGTACGADCDPTATFVGEEMRKFAIHTVKDTTLNFITDIAF